MSATTWRGAVLAAAILVLPGGAPPAKASEEAEAGDPARPRGLIAWMRTITRFCREQDIRWDKLSLELNRGDLRAAPTAALSLVGPNRFWKLSRLVPFRVGVADLRNLGGRGDARVSEIVFDVAADVPPPPPADAPGLSPPATAIRALIARCQTVSLESVIVSRARPGARAARSDLVTVPVRVALDGDPDGTLGLLEAAGTAYPHLLARTVSATLKDRVARVSATFELMVRPPGGGERTGAARESPGDPSRQDARFARVAIQRLVLDRLKASTPGLTVTVADGQGDPILATLGGTAPSAGQAADIVATVLALPGLSGFDALGFRTARPSSEAAITGLLEFRRGSSGPVR
jgi:hypothetical protein